MQIKVNGCLPLTKECQSVSVLTFNPEVKIFLLFLLFLLFCYYCQPIHMVARLNEGQKVSLQSVTTPDYFPD